MSRQIPVTPERFARAIARAVERDFEDHIDYRWTYREAGQPAESFFEVESSSQPGEIHGVRVYVDGGDATVTCTCECGLHAKHPCWHQAGALMLLGALDEPDEFSEEAEVDAAHAEALTAYYTEIDAMYAQRAWEAEQVANDDLGGVPF